MPPRLLFLSQCLPYPPHSGVTNRTFNILRQLQKEFAVSLLAFSRRNHQAGPPEREASRKALGEILTSVAEPIPIPSERSRMARVRAHLSALVTGAPYTYWEYRDARFRSNLERELAQFPPDLIHFDSLDLYGWRKGLPGVPVTCTHHSIESELLRMRADHVESPSLSWYLRRQGDLVERLERDVCPEFAVNVMMSAVDGDRLRALAPKARTMVVPNGVDAGFFVPRPDIPAVADRVAFLGPTYMFPNRDAVQFFLGEVWALVRKSRPNATFTLIGKVSDDLRRTFEAEPGVRCLGFVPDIRPPMAEAACCVVPIRVGGGTRLKILDAWAMGKAVVSTTVGCEGLETVDGENILIRDSPEEFAAAVVAVLTDSALRGRLELGARETAERVYDWNVVGQGMRTAYRELLAGRPLPRA